MIDQGQTEWYKDAIIYQLHIKAFFDSTNDGIGDFSGLLQKLDYVQALGVNTVWVLPFYPSPLRDDGYDIADYRSVNPAFGTLRDVRRFVKAAHERGLRVITELVINHTSDQHHWFQRARRAKPGDARHDPFRNQDEDRCPTRGRARRNARRAHSPGSRPTGRQRCGGARPGRCRRGLLPVR
ncbi:MAG: hypothetical protein EHM89_20035 [Acidobacteria bacterium]|nr:MAG: hypothetical protein EHM89_20035 [Acidobacteriota bacterium]